MLKRIGLLTALLFAACTYTVPKLILTGHLHVGPDGSYVATIESAEPYDGGVTQFLPDSGSSLPDLGIRDAADETPPIPDSGPTPRPDAGPQLPPTQWTTPSLGTNLGEPYDYQGEWAFLNAFHQSRGWQSWGNYVQNRCCLERVIKWEGTGSIQVSGVQSQRPCGANRICYVARPEVRDAPLDQQSVLLKRTGDVQNVVDVELGHETRNQLFHPLFLDRLSPFTTLRFMDWGETNNSTVREWADRAQPNRSPRVRGGVAIEDMLELCNNTGKNAWLNIPHQASNDYAIQLALLIKQNLNPNLKVFVEYSNEVWNDMFQQAQYARAQGLAHNLSTNAHHARLLFQAKRSVELWNVMRPILGDQMVRVMGGFLGDDSAWSTGVLLDAGRGHTDVFAVAGYFYSNSFDSVEQTLSWLRRHKAKTDEHQIPLITYEGGQHLIPGVAESRDFAMYDRYVQLLMGWKTLGGGLFVHFTNAYLPGGYGSWGALEYTNQSTDEAHKYRALRDVSNLWR